jgi:hypothetical protein
VRDCLVRHSWGVPGDRALLAAARGQRHEGSGCNKKLAAVHKVIEAQRCASSMHADTYVSQEYVGFGMLHVCMQQQSK